MNRATLLFGLLAWRPSVPLFGVWCCWCGDSMANRVGTSRRNVGHIPISWHSTNGKAHSRTSCLAPPFTILPLCGSQLLSSWFFCVVNFPWTVYPASWRFRWGHLGTHCSKLHVVSRMNPFWERFGRKHRRRWGSRVWEVGSMYGLCILCLFDCESVMCCVTTNEDVESAETRW